MLLLKYFRCDTCADGFYGDARAATPDDCAPCPCPRVTTEDGGSRQGRCYLSGATAVCTECPAGRTGARCEQCVDGYYGDPEGVYGAPRPCVQCQCNGNIDLAAAGNCDAVTGECLKCVNNTAGERCEVSLKFELLKYFFIGTNIILRSCAGPATGVTP